MAVNDQIFEKQEIFDLESRINSKLSFFIKAARHLRRELRGGGERRGKRTARTQQPDFRPRFRNRPTGPRRTASVYADSLRAATRKVGHFVQVCIFYGVCKRYTMFNVKRSLLPDTTFAKTELARTTTIRTSISCVICTRKFALSSVRVSLDLDRGKRDSRSSRCTGSLLEIK